MNQSPARNGGFLRILGIVYLIKILRRRRERRRLDANTPHTD